MGKPTGFLEYERETGGVISPEERIQNFNEFHIPLSSEMQQKQGARCMDCGVPFCQSGMMIGGMVSGCPLNNLVPEWNDLIYNGNWEQAWRRKKYNCESSVSLSGFKKIVKRLSSRINSEHSKHIEANVYLGSLIPK